MNLPAFKYHPDPLASGSVIPSSTPCVCCKQSRGYVYAGPTYSMKDYDDCICPWCIADGSAHTKLDAIFVDPEAFSNDTPEAAIEEVTQRTPGYIPWQSEHWPGCCNDATAFIEPAGIKEVREKFREFEFNVLGHIIYEMKISGGLATRLLESLNKDNGPTVFIFKCLHCDKHHFHIDQP